MDREVIARGVAGDQVVEPPRTLMTTIPAAKAMHIPQPVSRAGERRRRDQAVGSLSRGEDWRDLRRLCLIGVVTALICGAAPALVGLYVVTYNQAWAWVPGPLLMLAGVLLMTWDRR